MRALLVLGCILSLTCALSLALFVENSLRLDPMPTCDTVVANFSQCVSANLISGACTINWADDGELALCLPCLQYYAPWMSCICPFLMNPYGGENCTAVCVSYWSCAASQSFDNAPPCASYIEDMGQCVLSQTNQQQHSEAEKARVERDTRSLRASALPTVTSETIIPNPPWPYAHACSLTQDDDGTLLAVFDAGPAEQDPALGIWYSLRSPNGNWSAPQLAVKTPNVCNQNPSLFQNADGDIFLTYHLGGGPFQANGEYCDTDNWTASFVVSKDGGRTWGAPTALPEGFIGGVKNKCILISNGAVLCPGSTEGAVANAVDFWLSHVETTNQNFSSWSKSNDIWFNYNNGTYNPAYGNIQPTLFEVSPGRIVALLRTGVYVIAAAVSTDYGATFSQFASPTLLPNPDAGIDGTVMNNLPGVPMILLYNHSPNARNPLSLAVSKDGLNWVHMMDLRNVSTESYQYPAVIQDRFDPTIAHVCYTYTSGSSYRSMAYSRLQWPSSL